MKMISTEINELEYRINQMKKNMVVVALETGLDSIETLQYSQKLDKLIMDYQQIQIGKKII